MVLFVLDLGSRAAIYIVEHILKLNPDAVFHRDIFGAMPLLLGCLNGISLDVAQIILNADGGHSAKVLDKDNRTTLYHVVEYACVLPIEEDSSLLSIDFEHSVKTIELILSVAPETVHFTTLRGDSPLDIPQIIVFKRKDKDTTRIEEIYHILKATSIKVYQRQRWESGGYDNVTGRGQPDKFENNYIPSLLSSQASFAFTNSKAPVLYEELEK